MEETVVVANEYFPKACCPKPSALENSNEDQMESYPVMCFTLLIKEKTECLIQESMNPGWPLQFYFSVTYALLSTWQAEHIIFKGTRYLLIKGL